METYRVSVYSFAIEVFHKTENDDPINALTQATVKNLELYSSMLRYYEAICLRILFKVTEMELTREIESYTEARTDSTTMEHSRPF